MKTGGGGWKRIVAENGKEIRSEGMKRMGGGKIAEAEGEREWVGEGEWKRRDEENGGGKENGSGRMRKMGGGKRWEV